MFATHIHAQMSAALLENLIEITTGNTSGQDSRASPPARPKPAPISEPKNRPRCVPQRQQALILPIPGLPRKHHAPRDPSALSGRSESHNKPQYVSIPRQDLPRL